ncbi:PD-(D/E)XK nuclease family protein [Bizionia paragorgiae]|uniref:PD-(D/E)XK nuclease superfamily protein n=1 Tax=Bizionia paragorgiae TaxID=283786 RepID=A0A1H4CC18_BIZPA|nr:PD-(D/E)XK nuclease family protein [Bizionia paragorgiae]SEA57906.1 PD-(D/E)XK nuclease superfamily protein [Bizionia paragorgiae]
MKSFIFDVLHSLHNKGADFSNLTFILPSKRAGVFLRQELSTIVEKALFSPEILSIEEFIEDLAELKTISNTELLFEFYNSYLELTPKEDRETFESFSKWAQILLQDFNEIDRYLIPQNQIFDYLSAIKKLDHWSLDPEKTEFVSNYLKFWDKLKVYYKHFSNALLAKHSGYQGLVYREAANKIESYCKTNPNKPHIFLGFNALNTAEETIIQNLLTENMAEIFWDIDSTFLENPIHDAALFTRKHKNEWPYFKTNPFQWITENYKKEKNITLYGVPKNIGQAKTVGSILNTIRTNNPSLKSTAVVLGDENLLIPVLNSIPKDIEALNITMGFPLQSIPLASLFELLFTIHKKGQSTFYYKDVISVLSHQFIKPLFETEDNNEASIISDAIKTNNLVYLTLNDLKTYSENPVLTTLFSNWKNNSQLAISNCFAIITVIKEQLSKNKSNNLLPLEYVFRFNSLFNELYRLNESYNHIKDISALFSIYNELLSSETLDFQGEPLQGLQVMGMLESRVLDFETVILTSVNEGILPSGKSNNSFIPFDVKIENNLPTYKEKDAVYTYHFYRLLQRAKNIYILYNTQADALTGGEKSRFINQLQLENIHTINHQIVVPQVPTLDLSLKEILKTDSAILKLKDLAAYGFSPSSLTSYMRNPLDFYYQKLLGIKDLEDVEETVAANTLGTVVHDTLEALYTPYKNQLLTVEHIKEMKSKIEDLITHFFTLQYKEGDITKGKNLIIFEIAKRYVLNFLNLEIKDLKQGNSIKIIALEQKSEIPIHIPELGFKIALRGTVDRVDEYNGITRIIDYKTGKVNPNEVTIQDWVDITTDYKKFSKSFQILTYAYMMHAQKPLEFPVEAGIISFKNLSAGVMQFGVKASSYARTKDTKITQNTLDEFEKELKKLIIEICNPAIPFIEKEV